jgi:hypothetical protein
MAVPESPIPTTVITQFAQLTAATRQQNAVTLAAAIITASGRPHSIEQALEIQRDIYFALYGDRSTGAYQEWEKTKDARLKKVHGPVSS